MLRTFACYLALCVGFTSSLGLQALADPIRMTVTGNAGLGPVDLSSVLADGTLDAGYYSGPSALGSILVGNGSGSLSGSTLLTINLVNIASPDSQGATLTLSGVLTGQYGPQLSASGSPISDNEGGAANKITAITLSGYDPVAQQMVSVSTEMSNGAISAADLARFASMTDIPEPLLATLTTPSQYSFDGVVAGGINATLSMGMSITPLPSGPTVLTPEPTTLALLGLVSVAFLTSRYRARRS